MSRQMHNRSFATILLVEPANALFWLAIHRLQTDRMRGGMLMTTSLHPERHDAVEATIPVIDLEPVIADVPGGLETAAADLCYALEEIGFFIIINHGVP